MIKKDGSLKPPHEETVAEKFADLEKHKKTTSIYAAKVPAHIKTAVHYEAIDLGVIPMIKKGGCGRRIPASLLGVKPKMLASFLGMSSKVTDHPGRDSFAVPGAGASQKVTDQVE